MKISVKKKTTFSPLVAPSVGGDSANQYDIIDDAVIASLSVTNRLTVDGINAANPLNNPTPFSNVPEVVEGSEN